MKRDILFLHCQDGHDWVFKGGRACDCEDVCGNGCSIPVHECSRCGDCDYGENEDAQQVKRDCDGADGTEDKR